MSEIERQGTIKIGSSSSEDGDFQDISIDCIDCSEPFIWSAGEQIFFLQKQLTNPPKRCKPCKRAKNRRIEAVAAARSNGHRQRVEVRADCAHCGDTTTVPFFPSQGRPVYCRRCFLDLTATHAAAAAG
ncbi:MAG: zinc-ribbon domain containing protein [Pyrinomonadaceae bacterium]|nr:zinc-ribbon domain containing protein [Pyrinomonadaceae bacterium]